MLDNISPYKCYFIQKASPSNGDAFDFSYIYKFYTDRTDKYQRLKYIIRVEAHDSVFALKFYAARDRKLDKKYNRILQAHGYTNSLRIFVTCAYLVPEILKKHPNASFAINGASSIDIYSRKREGKYDNQRFRKGLLESLTKKLTPEEKDAKKKEIREMEENYNLLVSISGGTFY